MGKERIPVVRQLSWFMLAAQLSVGAAVVALVHVLLRPATLASSILIGLGGYLLFRICSWRGLTASHRKGLRLVQQGHFSEDIPHFERSYEFLSRHPWIDRFRWLFLQPSVMTYREMSLINTAFCYAQTGRSRDAERYYQKTLDEFPDSVMARLSLNFIEQVRKEANEEGEP